MSKKISRFPEIKRLRKRAKTTLKDKVVGAALSVKENPGPFIYTGIMLGAGAIGAWAWTEAVEHCNLTHGYQQAYDYITNMKATLQTAAEANLNPGFTPEVLDVPISFMKQSVDKIYSQEGQNILNTLENTKMLYSTGGIKEAVSSLDVVYENLAGLKCSGKEVLLDLAAGAGTLVGAAMAVLGGIGTLDNGGIDWDTPDFIRERKNLKAEIKSFEKQLKDQEKNGAPIVGDALRYIENLGIGDMKDSELQSSLYYLRSYMWRADAQPIISLLSTNPRLTEANLGKYVDSFSSAKNEDDSHGPIIYNNWGIKRSDLFLKLVESDFETDPTEVKRLINRVEGLNNWKLASALISGEAKASTLIDTYYFTRQNMDNGLSEDLIDRVIDYKLSPGTTNCSEDINVRQIELGDFARYANQRTEGMNISETITLLGELSKLRSETGWEMPSGGFGSREEEYRFIDLMVNAYGIDEHLGKHCASINPKDISEDCDFTTYKQIYEAGFIPTTYLANRLAKSTNREVEITMWKKKHKQNSRGKFNPKNNLRRNLEYTNYCSQHESKGGFPSFSSYESIFEEVLE